MTASFAVLCYLSLKKRYKLIQAHNMPDYLIFIGIIHKIIGVPLILDLHDLTVELFETKWGRGKRILNSLVKFVEKISCGFANEIITTSTGFKERLVKRGISDNKITLVLNSADHYIFTFNPQREFHKIQKDLRLLYHGTVTKRFGLTTVIEAVAQLQDTIPETTLEIYGKYDDSYREELHEKINSLGINDHIIMGGYLSLEEISLKIKHSHIGIVPYLSDPFMNLALSTKTFEYVAMGLPVIASRLPSLTSIFDDKCINYFEPGNAEELSKSILEFCLNPELRNDYVHRALKAYKDFAWPVMAGNYFNLIKRTIKDNGEILYQKKELSLAVKND